MGAMSDVQLYRIQILSIVGSIGLLVFIFGLLRQRRLREEYSLLWLGGGFCFLAFSLYRPLLAKLSATIGIAYPPAALFLILIMGAYMMLLHFSLVFSRVTDKTRAMAQEIALLRLEVERLRGAAGDRAADEVGPRP